MTPKISLLMANLNNGRFIQTAIESVLDQSIAEWELIIVDDGSTDDSVELIRNAATADKRITAITRKDTRGVGFTKKECAEQATAKVIAVLDPDDFLAPNALETHIRAHEASPDVALGWSNHYLCDSELTVIGQSESAFVGDSNAGYLVQRPGSIHSFWSCKTEAYGQTRGFSPEYVLAEDQDLFYKLEEVGATLYVPGILYYYRLHARGISTGGKTAEAFGWHLIAMVDAFRRRLPRMDDRTRASTLQSIELHWRDFSSWGITVISGKLLFRLIKIAYRNKLAAQILWAYSREVVRRRMGAVA